MALLTKIDPTKPFGQFDLKIAVRRSRRIGGGQGNKDYSAIVGQINARRNNGTGLFVTGMGIGQDRPDEEDSRREVGGRRQGI